MTLRHALSNAQWRQIEPLLPKFVGGRPSKLGERQFVDAVIWRAKTGCPWRDLHPRFGSWKTVYNRFRDWSIRGIWPQMVYDLMEGKQWSDSLIDSTVVRAHQHASGGPGGVKKTLSVAQKEELQQRSMLWSILAEILEE